MTAIFITILNMSITASVVALAVMLARVPLRKAPTIFSYVLWGVVLFRLVIPFSIESIFSLMPTTANVIPQDIAVSQNPVIHTGVPFIDLAVSNALPVAAIESSINPFHVVLEVAGYVWLLGFVALMLYAAIGYMNLKRRVYFAILVRDNIFESDRIKTPFVLGLIHPKIYFPVAVNPEQHDYILKHEQTHIKRRDYIIKPFAFAVLALHWFNPVIWISYFLMSKDMEMSCDEAVLRKTNEDIRADYSTSLLSLSVEKVSLLNPIAFAFGESNVKERVANVLNFKKTTKWISVVSFIAVAVFLVGFTSNRVPLAAVNIQNEPSENTQLTANVNTAPPLTDTELTEHLTTQFEVYRDFGLIYNPLTDHLYFNGELVRYFEDWTTLNLDGSQYATFGITHFTENGTVDVRATRDLSQPIQNPDGSTDPIGTLLGVEPFSQAEFDARDIDAIRNPTQNSVYTFSGVNDSDNNGNANHAQNLQTGNTAVADNADMGGIGIGGIFAGVENFGITFSGNLLNGGIGNIYYNGQLVRTLIDGNGITLSSSDRSGSINVRTVRDSSGNIADLDVLQVHGN
jgi:beta-lactamase regulating signal transducer with metallopeptidase domain